MSELAPIILFVYNRLDHTKQTIEALQSNILAKDSILYIYSDAAKSNKDEQAVKDVREYIYTIEKFKIVHIIEHKENHGLANSIINGVTKIVNEYEKIIVLEDDLVTSQYFLEYMNQALTFYENDNSVMQISGYAFPVKSVTNDAYLLPITSTWGWGTWCKSWSYFIEDSKPYLIKIKQEKKKFNFHNTYNYYSMLVNQTLGNNSSWGIRWYLTVYLLDGVCLYPSTSLVSNIGHDGSGEHCKKTTIYDTVLASSNKNIFSHTINTNMVKEVRLLLKKNKRRRVISYILSLIKGN